MTTASPPYVALTIAGSDSSGGAGIQADLKSFTANGVYGASVITAVTAQNSRAVEDIHLLPLSIIQSQLDAVLSDFDVRAIKIGMVGSVATAKLIANYLRDYDFDFVVLDTPLMAGTGAALGDADVRDALIEHLVPLATLVTPNIHEAALMLQQTSLDKVICSDADCGGNLVERITECMKTQAAEFIKLGSEAVLLKGGHMFDSASDVSKQAVDVLHDGTGSHVFVSDWVDVAHNHGTGCALASAITAQLLIGEKTGQGLVSAVKNAKDWLTDCLTHSENMGLGKGPGPLNIAKIQQFDL